MWVPRKLKFKENAEYDYVNNYRWYEQCDKCLKNIISVHSIKEWPRCLIVCKDCLEILDVKYA